MSNVHPSNSLQLIHALQEAGKSFEVQVGPDKGHTRMNVERMMEFFNHLIAPFIYLIKQVFLFVYGLTGNYGASIVLLSFIISPRLLDIYLDTEASDNPNFLAAFLCEKP